MKVRELIRMIDTCGVPEFLPEGHEGCLWKHTTASGWRFTFDYFPTTGIYGLWIAISPEGLVFDPWQPDSDSDPIDDTACHWMLRSWQEPGNLAWLSEDVERMDAEVPTAFTRPIRK